jgi:chromosome segregation ATPase
MEIAERLYGVTMQERGVSRVLPMNPEQMEQMKETLQKDGVL